MALISSGSFFVVLFVLEQQQLARVYEVCGLCLCALTVLRSRPNRHSLPISATAADGDDEDDADDKTNLLTTAGVYRHTVNDVLPKECSKSAENHVRKLTIPRQHSTSCYIFL